LGKSNIEIYLDMATRRLRISWKRVRRRYGFLLSRVRRIIERYEEQFQISLTPGAIEVIIIPLVEELEDGRQIDFQELDRSILEIFETLQEEPDWRDREQRQADRSSRSVLKAISYRWCRIPPICDRGQDG
jgi:hypothetical protein